MGIAHVRTSVVGLVARSNRQGAVIKAWISLEIRICIRGDLIFWRVEALWERMLVTGVLLVVTGVLLGVWWRITRNMRPARCRRLLK